MLFYLKNEIFNKCLLNCFEGAILFLFIFHGAFFLIGRMKFHNMSLQCSFSQQYPITCITLENVFAMFASQMFVVLSSACVSEMDSFGFSLSNDL